MQEIKVEIKSIERIVEFVSIMEKLNINAFLGQGNKQIDASSMIGVMTMDTHRPIRLTINESDEVIAQVIEKIDSFIVK